MFLLDTNVISETAKPRPDPHVRRWAQTRLETTFISAMTVGEIIKGIERLARGKRRDSLEAWLSVLSSQTFQARILPVNEVIAAEWGRLSVAMRRTSPCADSLLAATARVHNLTVATRNERDFADLGVRVLNPWRT